jgi:outer membrane protein assembly factor BamB
VTLGGRDVEASKHLAGLAAPAATDHRESSEGPPEDLQLPEKFEPLWQFRFFSDTAANILANAGQDWGPRSSASTMVPPAVTDQARVYVNLLGHHFAIDLATGKLLWRTAKFHEVAQKIQQQRYYVFPEQYNLACQGDRIFCISRPAPQVGQHGTPFRLYCLNAADGSQAWSSESVAELKEWSFTGDVVAAADRLFACGFKPQKPTELYLLAISLPSNKLLWNVLLGTHQVDQSQMYYTRTATPSLLLRDGKIYVDTHSGALVEVSTDTGSLNWGLAYESDVPNTNYWWGNQQMTPYTAGSPLVAGGTLYFKGMRSPRLYAVGLAGPKLAWQRPVSKSDMLTAIDEERLVLTGDELSAIGLEDRQLRWSTKVPLGTTMIRPLLTRNRVYQFTPRGIYELDKSSGDVVRLIRGADLGSLGGSLWLTPRALVTVSNVAVTAYPLETARATALSDPQQDPSGVKGAGNP